MEKSVHLARSSVEEFWADYKKKAEMSDSTLLAGKRNLCTNLCTNCCTKLYWCSVSQLYDSIPSNYLFNGRFQIQIILNGQDH